MKEDDYIPQSIWSGELNVFGVSLRVHVLDNGQRIIEEQSLADLFNPEREFVDDDIDASALKLATFIKGRGVPDGI
jgi:hypothetical protein